MKPERHKRLVEHMTRLQTMVAGWETGGAVRLVAMMLLRERANLTERYGLSSPARQLTYLVDVLLCTPVAVGAKQPGDTEMAGACKLLELIFGEYARMFFDDPPKEDDPRDIAIPAFSHYLGTGLLASVEQIERRISVLSAPYNEAIVKETGLPIATAIEITKWVADCLSDTVVSSMEAKSVAERVHREFFAQPGAESWSSSELQRRMSDPDVLEKMRAWTTSVDGLFLVKFDQLSAAFGFPTATAYWRVVTCSRSTAHTQRYPTDAFALLDTPLVEIGSGQAICPYVAYLWQALLAKTHSLLLRSEARAQYLRHRDDTLEKETAALLAAYFEDATVYCSAFETPGVHEHDIVLVYRNCVLVVECKASPPDEPFRDAGKAALRIKRSFASKSGIQHGCNQAERLRQRIAAKERVLLYGRDKKIMGQIDGSTIEKCFSICVTADSFGPIAVDLSIVFEKDNDVPYPWVTNIVDLETLLDGFRYRRWPATKLIQYLEERAKIHGRVMSSDELEIAGVFMHEETLYDLLSADCDRLVLPPDMSDIFDQIYAEKKGGPRVKYKTGQLSMKDFEPPDFAKELAKKLKGRSR